MDHRRKAGHLGRAIARLRLDAAAACALLSLPAVPAHGQCQTWGSEFSSAPSGWVKALRIFDSGSGPELYVGGDFTQIINGPFGTNNIARWNGSTWSAAGAGTNGQVDCFCAYDDGSGPALYLGGSFFQAGSVTANHIARWDGTSYSSVGPSPGFFGQGYVSDIEVFDDGAGPALYAAGRIGFTITGVPLNNVAKWDGTQWSPLGSGIPMSMNENIWALEIFDDGSGPALFVGGTFASAGGHPANGLARWDGTAWTSIGVGVVPGAASLKVWNDGGGPALYVGSGSTFTLPGGGTTTGIVKWDGTTWSAVGGGTDDLILAMTAHDDGSGEALYAGGYQHHSGGVTTHRISKWDGVRWTALGDGMPGSISQVEALAVFDAGNGGRPDLYVGGAFTQVANIPSYHMARWISCEDSVDTFCFGDGTFVLCPCQQTDPGPPNWGLPGRGCNNSQNTGGAHLVANGSPLPDSIVLRVTSELPTALTIFLQGNQLLAAAVPFGDGLRCIGGSLKRLYTKSASAGTARAPLAGEPSVTSRSAALGDPIAPGSLRYYQTYYRDPNPNFPVCIPPLGSTFNSSNGVRIVW